VRFELTHKLIGLCSNLSYPHLLLESECAGTSDRPSSKARNALQTWNGASHRRRESFTDANQRDAH
jgi:hypothetical protein